MRPRPSQSRALIPLSYRSKDLPIRRLAEGEGVEPSRPNARPGFQDQLRATARRLPHELAGTPGFEPRISGLESDGLPLTYAPGNFGACGRTRTYEGQSSPPDLQSGAFAAQPHMQKVDRTFQLRDFKSEIYVC